MQVMRIKFGDRRNDWKCCFCCHVRTGTIFLGVWHIMLQVLALSVLAVVIRHPEFVREEEVKDPVLPTPLSEIDLNQNLNSRPTGGFLGAHLTPNVEGTMRDGYGRRTEYSAHGYRDIFGHRKGQDINLGVVVAFCTLMITVMMVYGAVRGKPSLLMPFFCLQVFDFCAASLTAVGYLCYLPDAHRLIARNPRIPFQEFLLGLNPQCLSLVVLVAFMCAMMVKAYFIGVVWSCYRYLGLRRVAAQRTIHFIDPDNQNLLPDLPDYETAVGDPRFAAKKFPTPPPSYASATGSPTTAEPPTAIGAAPASVTAPASAPAVAAAAPALVVTAAVALPPEEPRLAV